MDLWLPVFSLLLFLFIPLRARRPEESVIEMNVSVSGGWRVCLGGCVVVALVKPHTQGQTEDSHPDSDEEESDETDLRED